jgi:hypothetical protein
MNNYERMDADFSIAIIVILRRDRLLVGILLCWRCQVLLLGSERSECLDEKLWYGSSNHHEI